MPVESERCDVACGGVASGDVSVRVCGRGVEHHSHKKKFPPFAVGDAAGASEKTHEVF